MRHHLLRALPKTLPDPVPEVLLHFDGANNSTAVLDTGAWKRPVTVFGNAKLDTANKVFGAAAATFDGSGDYMRIGSAGDVDLIGGSFTIECRVRFASNKENTRILVLGGGTVGFNSTNGIHLLIQRKQGVSTNWLEVQWWKGSAFSAAASAVGSIANLSQWYAISVSVDHAAGKVWLGVDGTVTEHTWTGVRPSGAPICELASIPGENAGVSVALSGQIDELRITKGQALYKANYTPAVAAFTDPTNQEAAAYITAPYISAVETEDGQALEDGVKAAYRTFVAGCRSDGSLSALKACCIMAGARTLDGALVPLVGPAPTNMGPFVAGDYNRETGLKGDGSTKYLNSGYTFNGKDRNNIHAAVKLATQAGEGGDPLGSQGALALVFLRRSTNFGGYVWDTTLETYAAITAADNTVFGVSRAASTTYTSRVNGVSTTYSVTSVASTYSHNVGVFGHILNNGTPGNLANFRMSFYSIGESLDLALLDARVSTLMDECVFAINTGLNPSDYEPETVAYVAAGYRNGGTLS